jgi:hypothetical protein
MPHFPAVTWTNSSKSVSQSERQPSAGNKPDAHRIPPRHQTETVVLDFVNPVRPRRRLGAGDAAAELAQEPT